MPGSSFSSDSDREESPARLCSSHKRHSGSKAATSSHKAPRAKADKDAIRRHKALERQFEKVRLAAAASEVRGETSLGHEPRSPRQGGASACTSNPLVLSRGVSLSLPDVSVAGLDSAQRSRRPQPAATFTPTAAGLREEFPATASAPVDFQAMLSSALASIMAAGIQSSVQFSASGAH